MRTLICVSCCLLFALPAPAGENAPTPAASVAVDDVFGLAPANTLFILYSRDLPRLLDNPVLAGIAAGGGPDFVEVGRAWNETFAGPTMIGVRAAALRPDALGVCFASRTKLERDALFTLMQNRLTETVGPDGQPLLEVGLSGDYATLRLRSLPFLTLFVAVRDGLVYGDTALPAVVEFTRGNAPHDRFIDSDDYRNLRPAGRSGQVDLFAYLNLRPLMPLAQAQLNELPGLYEALGLGDLEAIGLTADFSEPQATCNLSIAMTATDGSLARMLLPAAGRLTAIEMLPPGWLFQTAWAIETGSDWVDTICEVFEQIDPAIVAEYQAELAEVTREWGFDPQHQLLGNFVDQMALGVNVDEEGNFSLAVLAELRSTDLFVAHLLNLITAYRLPTTKHVHGGVEILCRADEGDPHICLAVVDDCLAIAGSAEVVAGIVDQARAAGAAKDSPTTSLTKTPAARIGRLNVARFAQLALAEGDPAPEPILAKIETIAKSDARLDLIVKKTPRAISIDFVLNDSMTAAAGDFLTTSVGASLARARQQARRLVSAANIKGLITSCMIHANDHKGLWPDSLGQLAAQGNIPLKMLVSPYNGSGPTTIEDADAESFYLYRPGLTNKTVSATQVVIAEREIGCNGGANFGFGDGHVEWIEEPDAGKLLAELRAVSR